MTATAYPSFRRNRKTLEACDDIDAVSLESTSSDLSIESTSSPTSPLNRRHANTSDRCIDYPIKDITIVTTTPSVTTRTTPKCCFTSVQQPASPKSKCVDSTGAKRFDPTDYSVATEPTERSDFSSFGTATQCQDDDDDDESVASHHVDHAAHERPLLPPRRVHFSTVTIHQHAMILGAEPIADGPPITIEWKACHSTQLHVTRWEGIKQYKRGAMYPTRMQPLSAEQRYHLLIDTGAGVDEIGRATAQAAFLYHQRLQTALHVRIESMEEKLRHRARRDIRVRAARYRYGL